MSNNTVMAPDARGKITPEMKTIYLAQAGRKLDTDELRLLPYLHYTATNGGRLERRKTAPHERPIIDDLIADGLIYIDSNERLGFTLPFWNCVCEIMWHAYAFKVEANND